MQEQTGGLRERKKRRTRAALADNALRLFEERGYDDVTVAEVAAAAGVSTRTFFGYFPHKSDVLFAGASDRLAAVGPVLAGQAAAGAEPTTALRCALLAGVQAAGEDLFGEHRSTRMHVVLARPDLQERLLRLLIGAEKQLVRHLADAYPDRYAGVGRVDAVALVGGYLGTLVSVIGHGIAEEHAPERMQADLERVFERSSPLEG